MAIIKQQMRWRGSRSGRHPDNAIQNAGWQRLSGEITITPEEGERYQAWCGSGRRQFLAACLGRYFLRSAEQPPTRLFICTGDVDGKPAAGGMLLRVMPAQNAQAEDFDHLAMLTETIKSEELPTTGK